MKSDKPRRSSYNLACPHCGAAAIVRSSLLVTDGVRILHVECSDENCGHVCAATSEMTVTFTHTIRPSKRPNPAVGLRQAPIRRPSDRRPANDTIPHRLDRGPEVPHPANDEVAPGALTSA